MYKERERERLYINMANNRSPPLRTACDLLTSTFTNTLTNTPGDGRECAAIPATGARNCARMVRKGVRKGVRTVFVKDKLFTIYLYLRVHLYIILCIFVLYPYIYIYIYI